MTPERLKNWLKTTADVYAQLSGEPPFLALYSVVLTLPPDIVEYLIEKGVANRHKEDAYFQYSKDMKIPIHVKE